MSLANYVFSSNNDGIIHEDFKIEFKRATKQERETGLYFAAFKGNITFVRYLIEEGHVDVDCKVVKYPAICGAVEGGNTEVIQYLIAIGANINTKNKVNGWSGLHYAAYYGTVEMVKMFVSFGADFRAKTATGKTALERAKERKNDAIVEYLSVVVSKDSRMRAGLRLCRLGFVRSLSSSIRKRAIFKSVIRQMLGAEFSEMEFERLFAMWNDKSTLFQPELVRNTISNYFRTETVKKISTNFTHPTKTEQSKRRKIK